MSISHEHESDHQRSDTLGPYLLPALIVTIAVISIAARVAPPVISTRLNIFTTIFLGIFIEASPFLVAGSILSGLLEVFVGTQMISRFVPRNPVLAALSGALLGIFFPVCECGVVPVTRRLYRKGIPPAVGMSFLLAAPVVNPIVLVSTYSAFGWGPILFGRFLITIGIAFVIGLFFMRSESSDILLPHVVAGDGEHHHPVEGFLPKIWTALSVGGDDFLDMVRYLIIGSMLAAAMQTFVPQSALLAIGGGPVLSIIVLMVLAFVLSICSTVDAFIALSFSGAFTTGSILAFLTFGPMVDIKSTLLFLSVFRRPTVVKMISLATILSFAIALLFNLGGA